MENVIILFGLLSVFSFSTSRALQCHTCAYTTPGISALSKILNNKECLDNPKEADLFTCNTFLAFPIDIYTDSGKHHVEFPSLKANEYGEVDEESLELSKNFYCFKIFGENDNTSFVIRGCAVSTLTADGDNFCLDDFLGELPNGLKKKGCFCKGDKCNSATSKKTTMYFVGFMFYIGYQFISVLKF